MPNQSLDGIQFYDDPLTCTIPEPRKTVSVLHTYSGSAIFQWPALLQGSIVVLKWDWMPLSDYNNLFLHYTNLQTIVWANAIGNNYTVVVSDIKGTYFKAALEQLAYRKDIELTLNIRGSV